MFPFTVLIVSSLPESSRKNPKTGKYAPHRGIDFVMPEGTTIKAPFSGSVRTLDEGNAGGGKILALSGSPQGVKMEVKFMHLSSFLATGSVAELMPLCKSGNTGASTGAHLHLEVWVDGKAVNPIPFLYNCIVQDRRGNKLHDSPYIVENPETLFSQSSLVCIDEIRKDDPSVMPTEDQPNETETSNLSGTSQKSPPTNIIPKTKLAPGIWQIIKLAIDSQVADRQVADTTVSTMQGSLINFFKKVVQEPFAEIFGDTYGDEYYFVVRKPPFDKEGVGQQSRLMKLTEYDNERLKKVGWDEVIYAKDAGESYLTIDDAIVISQNIGYAVESAYSWYYFLPQGNIIDSVYIQRYTPAVFFPEYASVWGSKPLCVSSNYYHWIKSGVENINEDESKKQNSNFIIQKMWDDFKYLVESNAYLPFTRTCALTISGFRGIKRGTWVRYKGFIYYVDAVQHNYQITTGSIDYVTTLSLSRGMKEEYIEGVNIRGSNMSYFNLIDFGTAESKDIKEDNWFENLSKWKVNIPVFQFFLAKEHMLHNGEQ